MPVDYDFLEAPRVSRIPIEDIYRSIHNSMGVPREYLTPPRTPADDFIAFLAHHAEECGKFNGYILDLFSDNPHGEVRRVRCLCGFESVQDFRKLEHESGWLHSRNC